MGIASEARAFSTTSTPRPLVNSMTASAKSPLRESITCFTPNGFRSARRWNSGGGDDLCSEVMRDLNGRHGDATVPA